MEVILAIDLKKGLVVKAFAGFRLNYKPLIVNSVNYSDPIKLIKKILKKIDLKKIYIADLDAIQNLKPNRKVIEKILKTFPSLKFLIDSGFDYPKSVYEFCLFLKKKKISNFEIILGTEKIKNYNFKSFAIKKKYWISIDFNGNQQKWIEKVKSSKVKPNLIFMFLKNVGGRGVSMPLISLLIRNFPKNKCTMAGGIKTKSQIDNMHRIGVESVIVSTLIHKIVLGTVSGP
tara:strand:+ start:626 stop:1318 length:693 start_codon:yes stop_codon:yes gene_type:complete